MNVVIPRTGITVQLGIMAELVNNPASSELMVTNNESYQIDNQSALFNNTLLNEISFLESIKPPQSKHHRYSSVDSQRQNLQDTQALHHSLSLL